MKYCLDCGSALKGRVDKKYCNDFCRSNYNNTLNRKRNIDLKEINKILKRNASILEKLDSRGMRESNSVLLETAGFDFRFFTHQVISPTGEVYNCCYNYAYHNCGKNEVLITAVGRLIIAFKG